MAVRTNDELYAALAALLTDTGAARRVTTARHRGFLADLIDTLLDRIANAPTGPGEANVQSDWDEADGASDAFIQNKPTDQLLPEPASANNGRIARIVNGAWAVTDPEVRQDLASAAAVAWDVDSGTVADLTAAHNVTLQISGGRDGSTALLRFRQDGTGSRTFALHSGVERGGRAVPTVASAANARTYLLFHRVGTTWVYLGIIADA